MVDTVGVDVNLNAAGFAASAAQISQAAGGMDQRLNALQSSAWGVQKAIDAATPSNKHIAGMAGFTAAAAAQQQQLSQLRATQALVGQSTTTLAKGADSLARNMPVGNRGALQLVQTVNQLGVAGKGNEKQITALANLAGQLQGATGESGSGLISDLSQLERTFGNQNLDPRRMRNTADSLTYLSKAGGASADAILQTANAIGPLAQAAGMGKQQTLGISTAMSRIGQDGYAAANAVNTLLLGINKSVRDGTPDLTKYANILGTTADQFKSMYQTNPAETITKLTEAIGQGGPQGGRVLESLGLDSVRSQRAFQALSASGGLRQQIQTAMDQYGGGSTQKAAQAAYGGLNDTLTKLSSSGEQLAQALGAPLLKPLNAFAGALNVAVGGLGHMVSGFLGTRVGGDIANVAIGGGLGLMALRRVAGVAAKGSLASYLMGSAPVRSMAGGYALSRAGGDEEAALQTRLGRFGRGAIAREAESGTQVYTRTNWRGDEVEAGKGAQSMFMFGGGVGNARAEQAAAQAARREEMLGRMGPEERASFEDYQARQASRGRFRRIGGAVIRPFAMGAEAYFNASADQALAGTRGLQGRTEELYGNERVAAQSRLFARGQFRQVGASLQDAWRGGGGFAGMFGRGQPAPFPGERTGEGLQGARFQASSGGEVRDLQASQRGFMGRFSDAMNSHAAEIEKTTKQYGPLRNAMNAFGASIGRQAEWAGVAGGMGSGRLLGGLGTGIAGLGRALGGAPGVVLAGGMLVATGMQKASQNQKDSMQEAQNLTQAQAGPAYTERAGLPAMTADTSAAAALTANTAPAVTTPQGAQNVTSADQQQAFGSRNNVTFKIPTKGMSADALTGLGNTFKPNGWMPQEAQQFKLDLLRQGVPQGTVSQVMSQLNYRGAQTGANAQMGKAPMGGNAAVGQALTGLAGQNLDKSLAPDSNKISERWVQSEKGGIASWATGGIGSVKLKDDVSKSLDEVVMGIVDRWKKQSSDYGVPYASEQEWRDINSGFMDAVKSGNFQLVREFSRRMSQQLGAGTQDISTGDVAKYGGFVQALAAKQPGSQFAQTYGQLTAPNAPGGTVTLSGPPGARPQANLSADSQLFRTHGLTTFYGLTDSNAPTMTPDQMDQFQRTGVMPTTPQLAGRDVLHPDRNAPASPAQETVVTGNAPVIGGTPAQQYQGYARSRVMDYFNDPGNVAKLNQATQAGATSMTMDQPNKNLGELAAQAGKAAGAIGDAGTAAGQFSEALQQELEFRMQAAAPYQGHQQNFAQQFSYYSGLVKDNQGVNTPEAQQNVQKGRQGLVDLTNTLADQLKQRLNLERQYNLNRQRAQEDFQRQESYAQQDFSTQQTRQAEDYFKQRRYQQEDYQRQVGRETRDFNINQAREEQDFHIQVQRMEEEYNIQRSREIRDFNIQVQRMEQDYLTQRTRAIRDFNIQISRMVEDSAQKLYDPYKRVQTQSVWDARQLMANLNEQNQVIVRQRQQLDQVRRMGLSNETIQSLGLNDPANAQQLNKLVNDFMSDPQLAKQLNATAAQRLSMSKLLVTDPSNKDLQRAREDFLKQLDDMEADQRRALDRARADMNRTLGDQAADFARSLNHTEADFIRALQRQRDDFNRSLDDAFVDYITALRRSDDAYTVSRNRAYNDFVRQMARMRDQYDTQLKRMRQDTDEAEFQITATLKDVWDKVQTGMEKGQADWNKILQQGLADTLGGIKDKKQAFQDAYANLVPFSLKGMFPGGGPDVAPPFGGPDAGHMPAAGGPYALQSNGARNQSMFDGQNTGSIGSKLLSQSSTARVSQGFGDHRQGERDSGGGLPILGTISQLFGALSGHQAGGHPGIDIAAPRGTPIKAPLPGVVVFTGWNDGYGNCVIMDNGGGKSTLYGHQAAIATHVGDHLKAGDLIGWVDSTGNSTGNHLHFETRINGKVFDPLKLLPIWESLAGLGGFDPAAILGGYGMAPSIDPVEFMKPYYKKQNGPWGVLVDTALGLEDLGKAMQSDAALADQAIPNGPQFNGPLQQYAKMLLQQRGWQDQWPDFNALEMAEAGWRVTIANPSSGAYGLAQALPPSKYASAGPDWRTNGQTQLRWMMEYIATGNWGAAPFRDPRGAWAFHRQHGWYGDGGIFNGPQTIGVGERGPELVTPLNESGVRTLAGAIRQVIAPGELKQMMTSGHQMPVYHIENHHHDSRVQVLGAVTVEAQDPNAMGEQLAQKARADALTSTKPRNPS